MILLDGKKTAADIKAEIALEVSAMIERGHKKPHLAAIIVGNDGISFAHSVNSPDSDFTKEQLWRALANEVDEDGSGEIDFTEFCTMMSKLLMENTAIQNINEEESVESPY